MIRDAILTLSHRRGVGALENVSPPFERKIHCPSSHKVVWRCVDEVWFGIHSQLLGTFDPEAYKELGEMINDIVSVPLVFLCNFFD